ncbi:phytanoyl-CoA dioxygenase family protein [Hephaestia sp. GCM10023244]|uniref:phytanoyl-CoA dioxygenase family protein n=1 Tax=unclassified Hephaestia TaxID=2631281 RepID=UPI0020776982|nr:phytanoyl-CoA dioxygenase family protein [Hephaestia sp. MAHUQ-44]MCM8729809.1 phytanoyl-CoA dioxygenase family protein [Hephaestia sp. MAHUQ-44]
MEIGTWKSMAGMDETYRQAREYGLETNLAELEAFGFTVIPPDKTGAPRDFAARLLDRVVEIAADENAGAVELEKHNATKPADGRQLFNLLRRDPLFVETMMNPVTRIMGAYMMGQSFRLSSMVAFYKPGPARSTPMHTDSVGVPTPLPAYSSICNISWVLSDYTVENGTFGMVPGSHRWCRHPVATEQPGFIGGALEEGLCVPVCAEPGSLIVFTGNTWHCTYPKTTDAARAHVVVAFCRNYVFPAERYDDMPDDEVARYGPEFARIIGREAWQGYRAEGPKLERLLAVRPAYQSQHG